MCIYDSLIDCKLIDIPSSLQLDIDDTEMVKTKAQGRKKLVTTSPLYFGGLPPGYRLIPDNVATQRHRFIGCIGDVTIQGRYASLHLFYFIPLQILDIKQTPF